MWCVVGRRIARFELQDRRIAELEAQIAGHPEALAAAKREALEEAARRYEVEGLMPYIGTQVAEFLRRMAREVKP